MKSNNQINFERLITICNFACGIFFEIIYDQQIFLALEIILIK